MTITQTEDLARKLGHIAHDARALSSLLQRLAGRYMAADDVDVHQALHLAGQIAGAAVAGAAVAGLRPPAAPAPGQPIADAVPGPGGGFAMSGASSMFTIAAAVLSSPKDEATPEERRRFHSVLDELLDAARAGGLPDSYADELDALMLAGKLSGRSVALAHEAARCAGAHCCLAIAAKHGI